MLKKLVLAVTGFFMMASMAFAAIDINSATVADLEKLSGIGPSKAQAIVDYRTKNGAFKTTEDIKKVSGIGDKTYEKIKSDLAVSGGGKTVDSAPAAKTPAAKAAPAAKPAKAEKAPAASAKAEKAEPASAPAEKPARTRKK